MSAKHSFITRLVSLVLLAVLAGSAYSATAHASDPAARPAQDDGPPGLLPPPGALPQEAGQAAALAETTPGVSYLTYHSFLFQPIRPETDWDYSFSTGTLHLLSLVQGGQFVMPLSLPNGVAIRELTFFFRDNSAASDLSLGLCRVGLGQNASFCLQWQVDATGVNTAGVVDRTLTGNPIVTVDNANFSYFLVAVLPTTGSGFGPVTARIGYAASTFLPEIHR